jgi:hypothetical protein
VAPALNLTGAWTADDGGIYYIRHLGDGTLVWAGLHNSGFHLGLEFANVFRGRVDTAHNKIEGKWTDVPRCSGVPNRGTLALEILEFLPPPPDPGEPRHTSTGGPTQTGTRTRLELHQIPAGTTGGFGAKTWRSGWTMLPPRNIFDIASRVHRVDSTLAGNNPPCRDFTVMWGTIASVGGAQSIGWDKGSRDYCRFINDPPDNQDGDVPFKITPDFSKLEPDFWMNGWINIRFPVGVGSVPAQDWIKKLFHDHGEIFEIEIVMFGRENDDDHCADTPSVLVPGWNERAGDSVQINGLPVNGHVSQAAVTVAHPPGAPSAANPPIITAFELEGDSNRVECQLKPGAQVRVTGVLADDAGHEGENPPEIHPAYSVDIIQDWTKPRPNASLTGAWHCDDVGTYYIQQPDENTLWWLGLSRDQGRTFANVFQGTVDGEQIDGEWVDIPMGQNGARGNGTISLRAEGGIAATALTAVGKTGGFGGSSWTKLYDRPFSLPPTRVPDSPSHTTAHRRSS